MLAASLNAFFCASPIYGSAEDFTFLLDFTPCEGLTPATKQQIGETRKKRNSDDRRQWRKQGGAVGDAVSRTRVPPKARSGRWVPQPVGSSASKSLVLFWFSFDIKREQLALMKKRSTPAPPARDAALPFSHAPFCISYYAFDRFAASAILSCATSDGDTPGMRPACPKFFGRMRASFSRASSVRPVSSV